MTKLFNEIKFITIKDKSHFEAAIVYVESLGYVPYSDESYTYKDSATTRHIILDTKGRFQRSWGNSVGMSYDEEIFLPSTEPNPRSFYNERIAHANGATIEIRVTGDHWEVNDDPRWCEGNEYRVAGLVVKERVFPKTSLSEETLNTLFHGTTSDGRADLFAVANLAIKQHILDTEK